MGRPKYCHSQSQGRDSGGLSAPADAWHVGLIGGPLAFGLRFWTTMPCQIMSVCCRLSVAAVECAQRRTESPILHPPQLTSFRRRCSPASTAGTSDGPCPFRCAPTSPWRQARGTPCESWAPRWPVSGIAVARRRTGSLAICRSGHLVSPGHRWRIGRAGRHVCHRRLSRTWRLAPNSAMRKCGQSSPGYRSVSTDGPRIGCKARRILLPSTGRFSRTTLMN